MVNGVVCFKQVHTFTIHFSALAFHRIVDSTKLLSGQHRPLLNLFWISPRRFEASTASVSLALRTLDRTPHKEITTDRGRYFMIFSTAPLLWIRTIPSLFHPVGRTPSNLIMLKRIVRKTKNGVHTFLTASLGIKSQPTAFPTFSV